MVQKTFSSLFWVIFAFYERIKRGYGPKNAFQPFLSHIRVVSKRIKRGYGPENKFQPFLSYICVLSKRLKRGYGSENVFQPFLSHIRVLSKRIDKTRILSTFTQTQITTANFVLLIFSVIWVCSTLISCNVMCSFSRAFQCSYRFKYA
jgi:hypothetical protein